MEANATGSSAAESFWDPHLTANERHLLGVLAHPHIEILEDQTEDSSALLLKEQTWEGITDRFNEDLTIFSKRNPENLRRCWEHLRSRFKVQLHDTGRSELILDPSFPSEFVSWVSEFKNKTSPSKNLSNKGNYPYRLRSRRLRRKKEFMVHRRNPKVLPKPNHLELRSESSSTCNMAEIQENSHVEDFTPTQQVDESVVNFVKVCQREVKTLQGFKEKIKANKKKRVMSSPFTREERLLLVRLMHPGRGYINFNRGLLKLRTWAKIAEEFNEKTNSRRTKYHIKKFWDNLKIRIRRLLVVEGFGCLKRLQKHEIEALKIMNPKVFTNKVEEKALLNALAEVGIFPDPGKPSYRDPPDLIKTNTDNSNSIIDVDDLEFTEEKKPLAILEGAGEPIEEQINPISINEEVFLDSGNYDSVPVTQEVLQDPDTTIDPFTVKDEPMGSSVDDASSSPKNSILTASPQSEQREGSPPHSLREPIVQLTESSIPISSLNEIQMEPVVPHSQSENIRSLSATTTTTSIPESAQLSGLNKPTGASGIYLIVKKGNNSQSTPMLSPGDRPTPGVSSSLDPSLHLNKHYINLQIKHLLRQVQMKEQKHAMKVKKLTLELVQTEVKHNFEIQLLQRKIENVNEQLKFWKDKQQT